MWKVKYLSPRHPEAQMTFLVLTSTPAGAAIVGVNQQMEDTCLSLPISLPFKQNQKLKH